MDQTNLPNPEMPENPEMTEALTVFFQMVQDILTSLLQGSQVLLSAQRIIEKEHDIRPGQCHRLVRRIQEAEAPVRRLASLWEQPERLPWPVRARRFALLVVLENTTTLLDDVLDAINALPLLSYQGAVQDNRPQREAVVEQMMIVIQRHEEISHAIGQIREQIAQEPPFPPLSSELPTRAVIRLMEPEPSRKLWLSPYEPGSQTDHLN